MKNVVFPSSLHPRTLAFYLAAEEYVTHRWPEESLFFAWRVRPTVIAGRNQLIESEVNLDYCREHDIMVIRRKSGGGCVYADPDNIMFSYITPAHGREVTAVFADYTARIASFLQSLGVPGTASVRNDVLIEGRKVSGNAFYRTRDHYIVHGTMLFGADPDVMMEALTPSSLKLQSKGVKSVRSRITTLSEYLTISLEEFVAMATAAMTDGAVYLTDEDVEAITRIEEEYLDPAWIYGANPTFEVSNRHRHDGVGEFQVTVTVHGGVIRRVSMAGDYFATGDVQTELLDRLVGVPYEPQAVRQALEALRPDRVIPGLTAGMAAELLMQ